MVYHISTGEAVIWSMVVAWDLVWRGIALWRSSRRGQQAWFVALLIINSAGVLPIVYLILQNQTHTKEDG